MCVLGDVDVGHLKQVWSRSDSDDLTCYGQLWNMNEAHFLVPTPYF